MRLQNRQDPMVKLAKKNGTKWLLVKEVMKETGIRPAKFKSDKDWQDYLLRNTNTQLATRAAGLKKAKKDSQ